MSHPPIGNTGGKFPSAPPVAVDWLNFTFRPSDLLRTEADAVGAVCSELEAIVQCGGFEGYKGLHGYGAGVRCKDTGAVVCWGGERQGGTVWVSLPGTWFSKLKDREALTWLHLLLLDRVATITRIDLCVDFFGGEVAMSDAVEWWKTGLFKVGGRQPSSSLSGDWLEAREGRTLYVGKARNGKLIRVYEKGKQLGDLGSGWVRIEVQFGNVDRALPLDMLLETGRYFAGAARWPFEVAAGWLRIRTRVESERVATQKLIHEARRAYGKLVAYLGREGLTAREVVSSLVSSGSPRRLVGQSSRQLVELGNVQAQLAYAEQLEGVA